MQLHRESNFLGHGERKTDSVNLHIPSNTRYVNTMYEIIHAYRVWLFYPVVTRLVKRFSDEEWTWFEFFITYLYGKLFDDLWGVSIFSKFSLGLFSLKIVNLFISMYTINFITVMSVLNSQFQNRIDNFLIKKMFRSIAL